MNKMVSEAKSPAWAGTSDGMAMFVAVVDCNSFASAALFMGVTPSAASKAVTRLETSLGVRLLHRTTRTLALSEEGRIYLAHARGVLSAIEAARDHISMIGAEPAGLVRVSVGSAFSKHRLVPQLPDFCATYPKVQIELNVTDTKVDPTPGQIDIAIRPKSVHGPELHSVRLMQAKRYICACPTYLAERGFPKKPEDLALHNCLLMNHQPRFTRWPFRSEGRRYDIEVDGSIRSDNADALLDLALNGHGIVRLLDTIIGSSLDCGDLISILNDTHIADTVQMVALVRAGQERLPRISAFLAFFEPSNPSASK